MLKVNWKFIALLLLTLLFLDGCTIGRVPRLIKKLGSQDGERRLAAAKELSGLGPGAEDAIPFLLDSLWDEYWDIRETSMKAIRNVGPTGIPILIEQLKNQDPERRGAAAYALALYPDDATKVMPRLLEMLDDENPKVRWGAVKAISAIGPGAEEAVPRLIELLQDPNVNVRRDACSALGKIGPAAKDAVPEIVRFLDDRNLNLVSAAIGALSLMGVEATPALPKLIEMLDDSRTYKWEKEFNESGVRHLQATMATLDIPAIDEIIPGILEQIGPAALPELYRMADETLSEETRRAIQRVIDTIERRLDSDTKDEEQE